MTNWNLEGLKPIKEYPGYFCNKQGDVYSQRLYKTHIHKMTATLNGAGYLHVTLRKNNKAYARVVHRLIAKTWLDNPSNKRTVNHIDGDKTNNHVSNLEWATDSENIRHSWDNGLSKRNFKPVVQLDKDLNEINEFNSILEAADKTGLKKSGISRAATGCRKTYKGYIWRFINV